MNKFIIASFLLLPFMANANSINEPKSDVDQFIQTQMDGDSLILKSTDNNVRFKNQKNTVKPPRNVCLYEGKTYSQGAVITVSGALFQCVDNQIMKNTENEIFDMRWERVPSKGQ
ncbi:DUF1496 domain-containing protein [Salmonella enterica]|nr:DUF1496 domain-containing protein [Salmonella enterica]